MSGPLVSIVIKNFNYERYVAAAIRSALDQTWPHVQVVVVDDGSSDDSATIIQGFGPEIDPVFFPQNRGLFAAVNAGYAAAKGEIIMFLDSDDALRPEAAAEVVAHWRPGLAKIQFCLGTVDRDGRFQGSIFPTFPSGLSPERVRRESLTTGIYPCVPTSGNALSREYLERIMPLPDDIAGASPDGLFNTVAPLYGDVLTLDKVLGFYRVHGANIWAQQGLNPERFGFYVERDLGRVAFLRQHAASLGMEVAANALDNAVEHMQYRLVSAKLAPHRHPIAGETLPRVAARAMGAVIRSDRSAASKVCLLGWMAGVTLAPRAGAERLVTWRYVPAHRPKLLRTALKRLSVLRRERGTERAADFDRPARLSS
ncbi:MAG TPA: glycosyltransferase family A protein [Azospirillaceae bacterium]|nr:glycosyltransferase family A protein [Azospirillaceae bacterium]